MDRLCWATLLRSARFLDDGLVHAPLAESFRTEVDEPRGRRPIHIAQEPHVRPRVPWPRATWTNWPLNPDLRQRQLTYLVQPA